MKIMVMKKYKAWSGGRRAKGMERWAKCKEQWACRSADHVRLAWVSELRKVQVLTKSSKQKVPKVLRAKLSQLIIQML